MIAVLLTASALKKDLGLPTCLAALAITAVVSIKAKSNPTKLAREISWSTLLLVAGLFVMVDAVESQGALNLTQQWLAWASRLGHNAGARLRNCQGADMPGTIYLHFAWVARCCMKTLR